MEKELRIPTDLSDEHFLMIRAAGLFTEEGIASFKKNSMISIVTSDYTYLNRIEHKVNTYSKAMAQKTMLTIAN